MEIAEFPKLPRDSYPELRDVTIKLQGNQEIRAHKCVLTSRLDYFKLMFSQTWAEVSEAVQRDHLQSFTN